MKIGLIIQGPVLSFGIGGAGQCLSGFNTISTIAINLKLFTPEVEKVIVSTWKGQNLNSNEFPEGTQILELDPISGFDFGNIYKQFFSNLQAAQWLKKNTTCSHIIKIRTDQQVPVELLTWVRSFYEADTERQSKVIFSDALISEPLYAGDFIIAARIDLFINFCEKVINHKRLHPVNAIDYVLKLAELNDRDLLSRNILHRTLHIAKISPKVQELWANMLLSDIAIIPRRFYKKIKWRGVPITDRITSIETAFLFDEDIGSLKSLSTIKSIVMPNTKIKLSKIFRKYREHWKRYLYYILNYIINFIFRTKSQF